MFDPNEHPAECAEYLSRYLESRVDFLQAKQLAKSTRAAPWKLEVKVNGSLKSYVLQLDPTKIEREYRVLKAMETTPIPTPRAYGLDLSGECLGSPCFFCEFVEGESLFGPVLAGEAWAEELYIKTVCELQAVTAGDLGSVAQELERESAGDILDDSYDYLKNRSLPLADSAYKELNRSMPAFPPLKFSNGDLWLDNFIVRGQRLVGVIDFESAAFSDPVFEFLLSFFVEPRLQNRGLEERYCRRLGCDPAILHWYHGLEFLDTWRWVLETGEGFVHHTAQSLEANLQQWLDDGR